MAMQHSHNELTEAEMQVRFFEHYDKQRLRVEKRQSGIMDKELARMGYLAQGSGQGSL